MFIMSFVVYHSPCFDGWMSLAVYQYFNGYCDSIPWKHHEKQDSKNNIINQLKNNDYNKIYFLDYCPDFDFVKLIIPYVKKVIILDHHKDPSNSFLEEFSQNNLYNEVIEFKYRNDKSGCQITWDYFNNKGTKYPNIVFHLGNKDIWNFSHQETEPYCLGISSLTENLDDKVDFLRRNINHDEKYNNYIVKLGSELIESYKKMAKNIIQNIQYKKDTDLNNNNVKIGEVECDSYEIFKYLIEEANILDIDLLLIRRLIENSLCYSVRSINKNSRADFYAQKYGGNGHPMASGFKM